LCVCLQVRLVQWYPGHIARAEKLLREQLKAVDAVVEVRDIRIPLATTHPDIPGWIGTKLRVLVLNRADMVSDAERSKWVAWFKRNGEEHVVLTDARSGRAGTFFTHSRYVGRPGASPASPSLRPAAWSWHFSHRHFAVKTHSIGDSQCGPRN
jgi:ribosome biogenesis GTPase A